MVNFCSDNASGAAPEILRAIEAANAGAAMPYGNDELTRRVEARLAEVFETEVAAFPVATGTAANALALSLMAPPFGAVYCHEAAHVQVDECGAPEFYTGGAKLVPLPGAHGKIAAEDLAGAIAGEGVVHEVQPAAVSLTQASEAGTVYTAEEIGALAEVARAHRLGLHVDGARFANAVASLGCAPAEITWKAGVDALSFGATKNGALGAEAVVLFKPVLAATFGYRRKRGGHLFSKMRFLSAQLDAYLADGLWLRHARHANAMARRLSEGLAALPGVSLSHAVEANEVFARLPEAMITGLLGEGFVFYRWGPHERREVRLVASFDTDPRDVDAFLAAARRLAEARGAGRRPGVAAS
ncbi:MAG: threonine aldolase family protein [Kiloniellaceae bacterium]